MTKRNGQLKRPPKPRITTKAQRTNRRYLQTSIGVIEGTGRFGAKERPFNYEAAVRQFHSWAYAAAQMNANAVASNPLRLYVRSRSTGTKLYPTHSVPIGRKRYLAGSLSHKPGASALKSFGDRTDYEEVIEHPILDLVQSVNLYENGYNSSFLRVIYQQLTGNAYLHPIIGSAGVPDELWTMPSQWMWIIPDRETFLRGYVYGQNIQNPQEKFAPDEVIHFKYANPRNLFYGLGKVEACWTQLGITNSKATMDLATFDNMARPDYLVAVKGGAATDALDRYEAVVNSRFRGAKNAGKFMAVSGDVMVHPLNWNPKDLGDTTLVVEVIASVFGVPVSKLKANQNVAGGQAEVSDGSYMKDTVHPLCVQDAEVLNARLLPMFDIGEDAVLCYDDVVPKDKAFEREENVQYTVNAIRTVNEVRELLGVESISGGDVLRFQGVPLDMVGMQAPTAGMPYQAPAAPNTGFAAAPNADDMPADSSSGDFGGAADRVPVLLDDIIKLQEKFYGSEMPHEAAINTAVMVLGLTPEQAGKLIPDKPPDAPKSPDQIKDEEAERAATLARAQPKPSPTKTLASELVHKSWLLKLDRHVDRPQAGLPESGKVNGFKRDVAAILLAQAEEIVKASGLAHSPMEVRAIALEIVKQPEWITRVADASRPFIQEGLEIGARNGLKKLPATIEAGFDVFNPEVKKYVQRAAVRLATGVNTTTEFALNDVLGKGLEAGESVEQLADRVSAFLGNEGLANPEHRAEMIARTESARAYSAGEEEAWKQSGVVEGKMWLLAADACEFCQAAAAEFAVKSVPLGVAFFKRGATLKAASGATMELDYSDVDGPPLHPQCRCALVPVLKVLV